MLKEEPSILLKIDFEDSEPDEKTTSSLINSSWLDLEKRLWEEEVKVNEKNPNSGKPKNFSLWSKSVSFDRKHLSMVVGSFLFFNLGCHFVSVGIIALLTSSAVFKELGIDDYSIIGIIFSIFCLGLGVIYLIPMILAILLQILQIVVPCVCKTRSVGFEYDEVQSCWIVFINLIFGINLRMKYSCKSHESVREYIVKFYRDYDCLWQAKFRKLLKIAVINKDIEIVRLLLFRNTKIPKKMVRFVRKVEYERTSDGVSISQMIKYKIPEVVIDVI